MKELTLEQMETTQGGKFWGTNCVYDDDGCRQWGTCTYQVFWIVVNEYPAPDVCIGPPECYCH